MTTSASVLGVLGVCWAGFGNPTQVNTPCFAALRLSVLGVLGFRARARVREFFHDDPRRGENRYAKIDKPNTPNTLYTGVINALISKGFICVGSVLGCSNVCWVWISGEVR